MACSHCCNIFRHYNKKLQGFSSCQSSALRGITNTCYVFSYQNPHPTNKWMYHNAVRLTSICQTWKIDSYCDLNTGHHTGISMNLQYLGLVLVRLNQCNAIPSPLPMTVMFHHRIRSICWLNNSEKESPYCHRTLWCPGDQLWTSRWQFTKSFKTRLHVWSFIVYFYFAQVNIYQFFQLKLI